MGFTKVENVWTASGIATGGAHNHEAGLSGAR